MSKYPIGPKTWEAASKTKSGQLADLLARIDYNAVVDNDRYSLCDICYVGETPTDKLSAGVMFDANHVNVEIVIKEVRDHLEWLALEEVIP